MKQSQVVLRVYAEDRWQDRILSGDAVREVGQWLEEIEARSPLAP